MKNKSKKIKKLGLVCSSGGHFLQLYSLKDFWTGIDHFWVSFERDDTRSLIGSETKYWAYAPTNRNVINCVRNFFLAIKIFLKEKPDLLLSTGAGVAVPFIYGARLFGIKTVYVESLTRVKDLSLTGKLIYPIVDVLLVQWPELDKKYKKAKFAGQVL